MQAADARMMALKGNGGSPAGEGSRLEHAQ